MSDQIDAQFLSLQACLRSHYGHDMLDLKRLSLGADLDTSVFRVETRSAIGTGSYFIKQRRGPFDDATVGVPHMLHQFGIRQIIDPIKTLYGNLYARLEKTVVILYPFIEGQNGFEESLSELQWINFGTTLKKIHMLDLPPTEWFERIPHETFDNDGRKRVMKALTHEITQSYADPVMAEMAALLRHNEATLRELVRRADHLATAMYKYKGRFGLCHGDIHAGNLLLAEADNSFYIVDWDTVIQAPKERDLMFIGGGVGGADAAWYDAQKADFFFEGYGPTRIDPVALAYYRYERIVQDFAVTCEQIFGSTESDKDRVISLGFLKSQFMPGDVIDLAWKTDLLLPPNLRSE